jgi:hypothetical protein
MHDMHESINIVMRANICFLGTATTIINYLLLVLAQAMFNSMMLILLLLKQCSKEEKHDNIWGWKLEHPKPGKKIRI